METMRERFAAVTAGLLDADPRLAVVLADISGDLFEPARQRHPDRVIHLGIREQLLISVAGGLSLAGMRPVAHTFASFLVERPFEQIKLDLNHQGAGAVLVSAGASYDYADNGRTHQAPGDVALLATLPGWTVHIPGHPDEAAAAAARRGGRRRAGVHPAVHRGQRRPAGRQPGKLTVLRTGRRGTVLVAGPLADEVIDATLGFDVTVLYAATIRPLDVATLRETLHAPDVVLVEPYLAGTSVPAVSEALSRPAAPDPRAGRGPPGTAALRHGRRAPGGARAGRPLTAWRHRPVPGLLSGAR